MSYALVFSGQGMQHPDMLPWLQQSPILQATSSKLGTTDWRVALASPAQAMDNRCAQIVLTGTALAAWAQLASHLPAPHAVAGYSVGELAAFSAAGVFDANTALDLAERRAAVMDACAAATPGGLTGVIGMAMPRLEALCAATGVAIAIHNGFDSAVVGGPNAALGAFEQAATLLGTRCTRLRVAVASHTRWMQTARIGFAQALTPLAMARPQRVLFGNVGGQIQTADAARLALSAQMDRTVRWSECMDNLRARQVRCVLEVGPGQALARMWNQQHPDVPARSCDEFRSAQSVVRWVQHHLD